MLRIFTRTARTRFLVLAGLALVLVAVFGRANRADAAEYLPCHVGKPCIIKLYQTTDNSIFMRWDARTSHEFDVYQIRWNRPGMDEPRTWEGTGHTYTIRNVRHGVQYHLRIQGCDRHFLAPSTCSGWTDVYITTR